MITHFPYYVIMPANDVQDSVRFLMSTDEKYPRGSSFAVTTDVPSGFLKLWMSEVSYRRIQDEFVDRVPVPDTPADLIPESEAKLAYEALGHLRPAFGQDKRHEFEPSAMASQAERSNGTAPCAECGMKRGATIHFR